MFSAALAVCSRKDSLVTASSATKPRVIITTDLEVDDMNSLIHLALYLNILDVEAIVTTASQYHFLGDGEHTLGEVTPHWRTKGRRAYEWEVVPHEPDPEAGSLMSYRPFPRTWIQGLWTHEYAHAWPTLNANAIAAGEPGFPTPGELIARTYEGNVAFEGDVLADTPGSDVIKQAILDDDPRTLWLLSWGGMNTIVRALISIAEEWQATPAWDGLRERIYAKVRVLGVRSGVGQDNSWLDHGRELFPGLRMLCAPFAYGGYVDAVAAQPDSIELFRAPWPEEHLTRGNGPLMARYMLYGDGKVYENEPERFQFGKRARLDWGLAGMDPIRFTPGDFMAEGDSMTYIPLLPFGLRGAAEDGFDTPLGPLFADSVEPLDEQATFASLGKPAAAGENPNPYLRAYQEDFAARAAWCAHRPEACNHAPQVVEAPADRTVAPGEVVELATEVRDPDGDALSCRWWVDRLVSCYAGNADVWGWEAANELPGAAASVAEGAPATTTGRSTATFPVPEDAQPGDRFVVTLTVQDQAARPMTRYAAIALTVH